MRNEDEAPLDDVVEEPRAKASGTGPGGRSKMERVLVVKAIIKGSPALEDPTAEIRALVETAGGTVCGAVVQKIDRAHPATYLGKGKVEEAARVAGELDVDAVVTDNDLSPAQERNLERITNRKVVDRSQLIMDIFSQRAQTRQAKLQVSLAQLRYSLPRLKRMWTHLSRFEGGIGMRGPGETQLEEDKRIVSRRIQKMARELEAIEDRKETSLRHREGEFVVALVGYTNAGKSTLLNRLTGSEELVEDKLFATLDTRVRRWPITDRRHVLLTDTVGFIRDLPHHLVASFHATLAETSYASLLLHVVDSSSPEAPQQMSTVRRVLASLDLESKETWVIFTKQDAVPADRVVDSRRLVGDLAPSEKSFAVSGATGLGLDLLAGAVLDRLEREDECLELLLPHERGDVLAFLRENGSVREARYDVGGVRITASVSPARRGKLAQLLGGEGGLRAAMEAHAEPEEPGEP